MFACRKNSSSDRIIKVSNWKKDFLIEIALRAASFYWEGSFSWVLHSKCEGLETHNALKSYNYYCGELYVAKYWLPTINLSCYAKANRKIKGIFNVSYEQYKRLFNRSSHVYSKWSNEFNIFLFLPGLHEHIPSVCLHDSVWISLQRHFCEQPWPNVPLSHLNSHRSPWKPITHVHSPVTGSQSAPFSQVHSLLHSNPQVVPSHGSWQLKKKYKPFVLFEL